MKEQVANDAEGDLLEQVKGILKEKYACYVLITCSEPTSEGQMDVEMNFEGDEDLAAMLVDHTAQVFDAKHERKGKRG